MLVIIMFTSALLKFQHEVGAAVLFVIAMGLFTTALVYLAREVRVGHRDSFSHRGLSAASARAHPRRDRRSATVDREQGPKRYSTAKI